MSEAPAFTDTPEFKKAVAEAATAAVAALLASRPAEQQTVAAPTQDFANSLATAIATLTHQGQGRGKPVDPAVLDQRENARNEMMALLVQAYDTKTTLTYQLRAKTYLDEVLIQPVQQDSVTKRIKKTEIDWPGIPNEGMVPINPAAKRIMDAFLRSIGSVFNAGASEPLRFSARGLVINGAPTPTQEKHMLGVKTDAHEEAETEPHYTGLKIHGNRNADYKPTRVLGTIAPASLETF